jgi:hypothetical protein
MGYTVPSFEPPTKSLRPMVLAAASNCANAISTILFLEAAPLTLLRPAPLSLYLASSLVLLPRFGTTLSLVAPTEAPRLSFTLTTQVRHISHIRI